MLTALILIIAVAGIVVLARRWPDVEAKLWPDDVNVPESAARTGADAEPADTVEVDEIIAEADEADIEEPAVEKTAGGLMSKKAIATEPDVDEPVSVTAAADDTADDVADDTDEPVSFMDALPDVDDADEAPAEPAAKDAPTPPAQSTPAASPTRAVPKPRVMGEPARPSQPAYVDATKRVAESFEQLSAEADKAWQERSYDKAEQACLKILVQQPKNHKYMTRIGQIYQETGDLEDAKEAFESAKKLDPKNFFVLNRLSEVERMLSDKGGRTNLKKPVTK